MRTWRRFALLILASVLAINAPGYAAESSGKANVMVVGVAHLVARRDAYNSVFQDDPLSPQRQSQIAQIVDRLAKFHPTKVLIEAPMGNPVYDQQYQQYVAAQFNPPANEIYQFGFKLAKRSGNQSIYPIDTDGPSLIDENTPSGKRIDAFLETNFKSVKDPQFEAFIARQNELELHGTYLDLLRYLNSDAAIRANASWYAIFAGMGRDADNAGSAYVSQWYARNCYIFSNILSVVRPGDRVVVLMGQGHEYLLREFVRLNPNLTYVDPLDYLK